MSATDPVTIVEVGPRDGFQGIEAFIPTERKIECVRALHRAGIRRMEVGACVSDRAVPQLRDSLEVIAVGAGLPDLEVRALVPTARRAARAVEAGVDVVVFVISVSAAHSWSNVRRTPAQSLDELRQTVDDLPPGVTVRVDLSTAFDCPFDGPVDPLATVELVKAVGDLPQVVEVGLCDTTGRVLPRHVASLVAQAGEVIGVDRLAVHTHDTYGMGIANVLAAYDAGIRCFDASFAGLGGCPFAPGATGNVATEDVVWAFEVMGVATGVDLPALLAAARLGAAFPTAVAGGRVRAALHPHSSDATASDRGG